VAMARPVSRRCYLVYALAPEGTSARDANDRLNEYVADGRRGLSVWHDHFVGVHGGAVMLDVRSQSERDLLDDLGPLAGWELAIHPLTFSLSAVGFAAQTSFTLESYRNVTLDELAAAEADDPRFWWRRRSA
jgi:hypothetical protein